MAVFGKLQYRRNNGQANQNLKGPSTKQSSQNNIYLSKYNTKFLSGTTNLLVNFSEYYLILNYHFLRLITVIITIPDHVYSKGLASIDLRISIKLIYFIDTSPLHFITQGPNKIKHTAAHYLFTVFGDIFSSILTYTSSKREVWEQSLHLKVWVYVYYKIK